MLGLVNYNFFLDILDQTFKTKITAVDVAHHFIHALDLM